MDPLKNGSALSTTIARLDVKLSQFDIWMRPGEKPNKTQVKALMALAHSVVHEYRLAQKPDGVNPETGFPL